MVKCSICKNEISQEENEAFGGMCGRCEKIYYDAQIESHEMDERREQEQNLDEYDIKPEDYEDEEVKPNEM